jgi:hypothetical protein
VIPISSDKDLSDQWLRVFMSSLQLQEFAEPLKTAALDGRLGPWTRSLTTAVARSCEALGWRVAAKGFRLHSLPQAGQEYLGIDVMAFAGDERADPSSRRWQFPVAVFELENSREDERVAYSLWKLLCIRCSLRVAFAYRDDWERARDLVRWLTAAVVTGLRIQERNQIGGQTLLVLGSRGERETFPHGFFKLWLLDTNRGRFDKM